MYSTLDSYYIEIQFKSTETSAYKTTKWFRILTIPGEFPEMEHLAHCALSLMIGNNNRFSEMDLKSTDVFNHSTLMSIRLEDKPLFIPEKESAHVSKNMSRIIGEN